ncbi:sulfurtransferase [Microlunatus sp. Gsoil 973]|jgi:thiosulfate/3-mercaptopyruvate sulfurtransferase|uniref:sulfurtransferase n=1 Tax=Microlunatus sp. Gsoil 973 TaxID=2672569 RepID=UPI0012B4AC5B|nr:sulfurtransferase [Microlunatus sp. Gsoil 973]QGN32954.1 sulfurtransferase [Microlunatus sp. Gsoil 973]
MALIEVEELAALIHQGRPPSVLDVRWRLGGPSCRPDYLAAHLPGARWVDLEADLSDHRRNRGRHPLPERAAFEAAMRRVGVDEDRPVVVYDADNALAAARLWWMLTDAGHRDVRVLNGGYAAWTAAGLPTEGGDPEPAGTGDFVARPGQLPSVDGDQLAELIAAGRAPVIIDVRGAERYSGESEPIDPVAGHIPGAVNVPSMINVDDSGRFRRPSEILANFPDADQTTVVYCGSGITAAHTALARVVAGLPLPTIYPGSWSDWITDPARPVATGDRP